MCLGAQLAISVNNCPPPPRSEVLHDQFQTHPAEVRPEDLPCPKLAGVRDGSPRSRESDRLARTHRWQARQLELAEAEAQEARPTTPVLEPRHRDDGHLGRGVWPGVQADRGLLALPADAPESGQRRARPHHDLEAQGEAGEGRVLRAANRDARPPPHRQQRSVSARRPAAHAAERQGLPQAAPRRG